MLSKLRSLIQVTFCRWACSLYPIEWCVSKQSPWSRRRDATPIRFRRVTRLTVQNPLRHLSVHLRLQTGYVVTTWTHGLYLLGRCRRGILRHLVIDLVDISQHSLMWLTPTTSPPQAKARSGDVLEQMQRDYPASLNNRLHDFTSNIAVSTSHNCSDITLATTWWLAFPGDDHTTSNKYVGTYAPLLRKAETLKTATGCGLEHNVCT